MCQHPKCGDEEINAEINALMLKWFNMRSRWPEAIFSKK